MPETPRSNTPALPEVQARLHEVARMLRHSSSLDPESQRALAELVDELSSVLAGSTAPPAEVAHLAESTSHLAETLHHHQDRGVLGKARDRLERAVIRAEMHAPVAVGLARRLVDALANIGV